jgi:hypothetical protein
MKLEAHPSKIAQAYPGAFSLSTESQSPEAAVIIRAYVIAVVVEKGVQYIRGQKWDESLETSISFDKFKSWQVSSKSESAYRSCEWREDRHEGGML